MAATTHYATRGGTRWRRSGLLLIPAMIVVGLLAVASLSGVLALNLALSGQEFKLTSNGAAVRTSQGMSLYPTTVKMKEGKELPIMLATIPDAQLPKGLCLSVVLTFPGIGSSTVQLKTTRNTHAKRMTLAADSLDAGSASLVPGTTDGKPLREDGSNLKDPVALGKDASELTDVKGGKPGTFGIEAPGPGELNELKATAKGAVIAGTASLGGLGIKIARGDGTDHGECF